KIPFLGICLGLQLLADFSHEDNTKCFGIIPGEVKRFPEFVKIPQIGWNKVSFMGKPPLLEGIPDKNYFYFVNSFYFDTPEDFILGQTNYGVVFPSIVQKNNFYATQFHPEKSGEIGFKLLRNFCEKC
ncbi:imidazole glycerol phosphate synthase subunit HisH, partial [Patescibacteria group bacterium]|nr:imidazole glycerol phosphate synthase subunit HisH [Patescibacteria group bacterium]